LVSATSSSTVSGYSLEVGELGLGRGAFGILVGIGLLGVERQTRLRVRVEKQDLLERSLPFRILEGLGGGPHAVEPRLGLRRGVREAARVVENHLLGGEPLLRDREVGESGVGGGLGGRTGQTGGAGEEDREKFHGRKR
jgi:hypothetical protein